VRDVERNHGESEKMSPMGTRHHEEDPAVCVDTLLKYENPTGGTNHTEPSAYELKKMYLADPYYHHADRFLRHRHRHRHLHSLPDPQYGHHYHEQV
jgi:hypothetical protein